MIPVQLIAPTGTLRAAINLANPVLAGRDAHTGLPTGVSVDMATAFAAALGVPLQLVPYEGAGQVVEAAAKDKWDVAFLAIEPARSAEICFSTPYVLIEGTYLVHADSPLRNIEDFDQTGVRIAVAHRAAYDLYLSRHLKHASLVRYESPDASFAGFIEAGLDAAAGIRQAVETFASQTPGLRVCEGRFLKIEQAMAIPAARAPVARWVDKFVTEMKASGTVRKALDRHGHGRVLVAD